MVLYQAKDETKYNECLKIYCFESEISSLVQRSQQHLLDTVRVLGGWKQRRRKVVLDVTKRRSEENADQPLS